MLIRKLLFFFSLSICSLTIFVVTYNMGWNPEKHWVSWMLQPEYFWFVIPISFLISVWSILAFFRMADAMKLS